MTVNYEVPTIKYVGNGVNTSFAFLWSCGDPNENYVKLDDQELEEGVEYELENFTLEDGGTVVFKEAPKANSVIEIYRRTPITQQVDYVEDEPFPADTHEFQMDKDTRILQEIIAAGLALGGRVDLAAVHFPEYVEITNTGGNSAIIKPWQINGSAAGVSLGEVVEFGGIPPQNGDLTEKEDGYIWWVLGTPPAAGGDPLIRMSTFDINVLAVLQSPGAPRAEFRFNGVTGNIEFGYDPLQADIPPGWRTLPGLDVDAVSVNQYYVRFDVTTGAVVEQAGSPAATWIPYADVIALPDLFVGWYVADPGFSQEVEGLFTIAPSDGPVGPPDITKAITRRVNLKAEQI